MLWWMHLFLKMIDFAVSKEQPQRSPHGSCRQYQGRRRQCPYISELYEIKDNNVWMRRLELLQSVYVLLLKTPQVWSSFYGGGGFILCAIRWSSQGDWFCRCSIRKQRFVCQQDWPSANFVVEIFVGNLKSMSQLTHNNVYLQISLWIVNTPGHTDYE